MIFTGVEFYSLADKQAYLLRSKESLTSINLTITKQSNKGDFAPLCNVQFVDKVKQRGGSWRKKLEIYDWPLCICPFM